MLTLSIDSPMIHSTRVATTIQHLQVGTLLLMALQLHGAGIETAWLQGDILSHGRPSLGSARASDIAWNRHSSIDPTLFVHEATRPGSLIVKQAGDYFVAATLPITSNGSGRFAASAEVYVNGRPRLGGLGQSSYIRNASGHNESSAHVHFLVTGLAENDKLELRTRRVSGGQDPATLETASFYVERIAPSRTVFSAFGTSTNSGTNVNVEPGTEDTGIRWTSDRKDGGFDHTDDQAAITLRESATYLVSVNIPLRGAIARGSVAMEINLDGDRVSSGLAQQGYIRNATSHVNSSLHWAGLVTSDRANQRLTITTFQRGLEGNIVIQRGKQASLYIERLDNLEGLFHGSAFETEAGESWNPAEKTPLLWDGPDRLIDDDVFQHSPGNTAHQVTLKQSGNYLLLYNDALEGGSARVNPRITVEVNGEAQPGAQTKSHYIRQADGHSNSSATLVYYLEGLSANDVVSVSTQREGGGGDPIAEEPATLTLIQKPVFQPDPGLALAPRVSTFQGDFRGFIATIEERGILVNRSTIKATVNDRPVALDIASTKEAMTVTFAFEEVPAPRSTHQVVLSYQDQQGVPQSYDVPFRIVITTPFSVLPPEYARLEPDTNKPGFKVRVSQISTLQSGATNVHGNTVAGAERQLRGAILHSETREPYLNEAGPLNATDWQFSPAEIETVINLEQDGLDAGSFNFDTGHEDDFIPHIPGWNDSLDGIVAEFTTFLELEPGFHTFGVRSDDGFDVKSDNGIEGERAIPLGSFNGSRGSADTLFNVVVRTPGLYPFRLLWFEGGGGANVELFHLVDDQRILVNDRDHPLAIKAYQEASGRPEPPAPETVEILGYRWRAGQLEIEFTGTLASSETPEGPYQLLPKITSPHRLTPNQSSQFFIAR